jgi:hypothetical protein
MNNIEREYVKYLAFTVIGIAISLIATGQNSCWLINGGHQPPAMQEIQM